MPDIVQKTLNPLPNSILIPVSGFTGKYVGSTRSPIQKTIPDVGHVWYGVAGDLNNDGYPEVLFSGQSVEPFQIEPKVPYPTPIFLFSTSSNGVTVLDPVKVLGINETAGTSTPRIVDINNDGRNDFMYFGFNEHPFYPTISQTSIQQSDGSFKQTTIPGPRVSSHNSDGGDFNGDGYIDFVLSSYMTDGTFFDKNLYLNIDGPDGFKGGLLTLYLNDKTGNFSPYALRYTKPAIEGWTLPDYFGGGAASAFADFDNDGKAEIVMVDAAPNTEAPKDPKWQRGDSFILSNITFGEREAWSNIAKLPTPYLEDKAEFASLPFFSGDQHSHDIKVMPFDVNNDGLMDILISSINWSPTTQFCAGVMQVLLNQGGLKFIDVTDSSLYNYFLGKPSAHDPVLMDVNFDGFVDIIMPDGPGQMNAQAESIDKTWANHILINAGNGKFVQAAWNELHELTMSERNLTPPGIGLGGIQDQKMTPYMLPDGRLGFLAFQGAQVNDEQGYIYFDFRANQVLSTGPSGMDPVSKGAPGYSEYYYLTQYPEVVEAINAHKYENGLEHYLKVGKANGYFAFAPNAQIHGSEGNDLIMAREGNEIIVATAGADTIDGGAGRDVIKFAGNMASYAISVAGASYKIVGVDTTITAKNVEQLQFSDQLLDLKTQFPNTPPSGTVSISGNLQQATLLSAVTTSLADKDGLGVLNFQWLADDVAILNANSNTYILKQEDVGKKIGVVVSYTDDRGTNEKLVINTEAKIANVNDAPMGSVVVTGTASQGQLLEVQNTLNDLDGLGTFRYQWLADGHEIPNAKQSSLRLSQSEVGKTISVAVSYVDGFGTAEMKVAAPTTAIVNVNDLPTGEVTLTGQAIIGQTLSVSNTLSDVDGIGTIRYQWQAGGVDISGANQSSFVLTTNEQGKVITVLASYVDGFGGNESKLSLPSAVVKLPNQAPQGEVQVSGLSLQGQMLTASNNLKDADGLSVIKYQWLVGDKEVAVGNSYILGAADVGKAVSVLASYVDGDGKLEKVSTTINTLVGGVYEGTATNDSIIGSVASDIIAANAGDDVLRGDGGNDTIDGGAGNDQAVYAENLNAYSVKWTGANYTVTSKSKADGIDTVRNVETVKFADMSVNLTIQGLAAQAPQKNVQNLVELYIAFFNRVPDAEGLAYWIGQMNAGQKLNQIAESFYQAGIQFSDLTGFSASMNNADFVNVVYRNVLGRKDGADADGLKYWVGSLETGSASRGSLVSTILASAHSFKGDTTWGWTADLLDNKTLVGKLFAIDLGLGYNTPENSIKYGMSIAAAITPTDVGQAIGLIGINPQDIVMG